MRSLAEKLELGFLLFALVFTLASNSKAGEVLPAVRPSTPLRPIAWPPRLPEPRYAPVPKPTYPEPRIGVELGAVGKSYSFRIHARF
jgi:hypothetical protein